MWASFFSFVFGVVFLGWSSSSARAQETVEQWCEKLSHELASVNIEKCKSYPWSVATKSRLGWVVPEMKWGDSSASRRILILGGIHGDEQTSVSLAFRWIDLLNSSPEKSDLRKIYYRIAPLVNPDGFFAHPHSRVNSKGIDLNRNFGTQGWEQEASRYWTVKTKKDPRRFPGHDSSSEPETQWTQKVIEEFHPHMIISIHAPYGILDHDGPVKFPKHVRSPLPLKELGAFPGSLGRYAGVERDIPVITVELMMAKKMPSVNAVEELFQFVMNSKPQGKVQSVVR